MVKVRSVTADGRLVEEEEDGMLERPENLDLHAQGGTATWDIDYDELYEVVATYAAYALELERRIGKAKAEVGAIRALSSDEKVFQHLTELVRILRGEG